MPIHYSNSVSLGNAPNDTLFYISYWCAFINNEGYIYLYPDFYVSEFSREISEWDDEAIRIVKFHKVVGILAPSVAPGRLQRINVSAEQLEAMYTGVILFAKHRRLF